jgi:hypothetical protein
MTNNMGRRGRGRRDMIGSDVKLDDDDDVCLCMDDGGS